jgi:hypothetical protein
MTDTAPVIQRRKQSAIISMLGMSLVLGIISAALYPHEQTPEQEFRFQLIGNFALLAVGFYWLHYDSLEHQFQRSALFNIGIVAIALIFVPYYFFRTRDKGRRAIPIMGFFGLIVASSALTLTGMTLMSSFAGDN